MAALTARPHYLSRVSYTFYGSPTRDTPLVFSAGFAEIPLPGTRQDTGWHSALETDAIDGGI